MRNDPKEGLFVDFRQLEVFQEVAECKSFSGAAHNLCLTQPTVSTHIRQLEEELGVVLIIRTTKRFELTNSGEKLYRYAAQLLELRDQMIEDFKGESEQIIRIGASTVPSTYVLPEVISKYRLTHPAVSIELVNGNSETVIQQMMIGKLDIGLVSTPPHQSPLLCEPFLRDELVIAAPATARFKRLQKEGDAIEKLFREPFIMREKQSGEKKLADRILDTMGIDPAKLNIIARVNDQEVIKYMIIQGLGVSIMSSRAARDQERAGKILLFPFEGAPFYRDFFMLTMKRTYQPKYVREFLVLCRKLNSTPELEIDDPDELRVLEVDSNIHGGQAERT